MEKTIVQLFIAISQSINKSPKSVDSEYSCPTTSPVSGGEYGRAGPEMWRICFH